MQIRVAVARFQDVNGAVLASSKTEVLPSTEPPRTGVALTVMVLGGRTRHVERKEPSDHVVSVRAGEVPVFYENLNPRVYRRLVCDWIAFQDLSDDKACRKLTRHQQVLAIITNIRGNSNLRMSHIPTNLQKEMSWEDFMRMVYDILDIVDPVDRESAFLHTIKSWKDLMQKVYRRGQRYDKYWTEYSTLSLHYAYSHGESAQMPVIQELLALLCVLNANLSRAEFSIVLQTSMRFHKEYLSKVYTSFQQQPAHAPYLIRPASASRSLKNYNKGPAADSREDSSVITQFAGSGERQHVQSAGSTTEEAIPRTFN